MRRSRMRNKRALLSRNRGGSVTRKSRYNKGGMVNRRKYQTGGTVCPPGQVYRNGACRSASPAGGSPSGRTPSPMSGGGYRRGGTVRRGSNAPRRMRRANQAVRRQGYNRGGRVGGRVGRRISTPRRRR